MSVSCGPDIVENGLILCLDAGNRESYSGSGTVWTDLASSNNGTLTNGPTFSSANGGSIVFDGSNDFVSFQNVSSINNSLNIVNNITIDCWIRVGNFTNIGGILTYGTGSGEQYALWVSTGFPVSNSIIFSSNWPNTWYTAASQQVLTNTPYHVIVTFSSGFWNIFINGVLNSSGTFPISTFPSVSNSYLTLGVNHPGGQEYFSGNIFSAKIYNRALNSTEVLQNYNALRSRFGY